MFLSKHFASDNFLPSSKRCLKIYFEFSLDININFICSNSPQWLIKKMSETDPGPLPTSKMGLSLTIIIGSTIYAKSPVFSRRHSAFITYYPQYCYPVKFPALSIVFLSLLYLLASKPGKICTHNSIVSRISLFFSIYDDSSGFLLILYNCHWFYFCDQLLRLHFHRNINKIKIL